MKSNNHTPSFISLPVFLPDDPNGIDKCCLLGIWMAWRLMKRMDLLPMFRMGILILIYLWFFFVSVYFKTKNGGR